MKKALSILMALLILMSMSLTVFASPGAFVNSPSINKAPELVDVKRLSKECTALLVITPYSERHTLPDDKLELIEFAYREIVGATDITAFNADFASHVAGKKIPAKDLAVSDLFDVSYYGCDDHERHEGFEIVVSAETLNRFVGLLHLHNGTWDFIEGARVEEVDGVGHLYFSVEELSPFAIIVNTNDGTKPPKTGDFGTITLYIALMVSSLIILVLVLIIRKRRRV